MEIQLIVPAPLGRDSTGRDGGNRSGVVCLLPPAFNRWKFIGACAPRCRNFLTNHLFDSPPFLANHLFD
jgi:hypothetical protein